MMKKILSTLVPLALLSACGGAHTASDVLDTGGIQEYVATIVGTEGNDGVEGIVTFRRSGSQVSVTAHIEGLEPNQRHGFHIHQYGDCSSADATSAGGHFNPTGSRHGGRHDDERHAGDLGNLESNGQGVGRLEFEDDKLTLDGEQSILGRGVIVHAQADDYETQPTGDAGGRIGCGVIGVAQQN